MKQLVWLSVGDCKVGDDTLAAVSEAMATERSALVAEPDDQMLGRIGYRETAEDPYGRRLRVFRECRERAASVPRRVLNG